MLFLSQTDIESLYKTFEAPKKSGIVIVRDIRFHSLCQHHLIPFYGTVSIGYKPRERIIGLSKFARITDAYARRLQVQEQMTEDICNSIMSHLDPEGCIVLAHGVHMCMEMRGINAQGATTTTMSALGCFDSSAEDRNEFFRLLGD